MEVNIKYINNLTAEELKQLDTLIDKANQEPFVRKPDLGECYYYVSDHPFHLGGLVCNQWQGDRIDDYRYSLGNCYKTRDEVEFARERQKVIAELERLSHRDGFDYKTASSGVYLSCVKYTNLLGHIICKIDYCRYWDTRFATIGFFDEGAACKAVEEIGEERILKYYFGVVNNG